jgi:hypothetical protein
MGMLSSGLSSSRGSLITFVGRTQPTRSASAVPSYYRKTQGILLGTPFIAALFWPEWCSTCAYAKLSQFMTRARRETEALPLWFAEWRKYVPKSTVKIVVDNKAEMVCSSLARIALVLFNAAQAYSRQVSQAEAAVYAARMGCLFLETSALTAVGVQQGILRYCGA